LEPLRSELPAGEERDARYVAARAIEALYITALHGIVGRHEHQRQRRSGFARRFDRQAVADKNANTEPLQLGCQQGQAGEDVVGPALLYGNVLAFLQPRFRQTLPEGGHKMPERPRWRASKKADDRPGRIFTERSQREQWGKGNRTHYGTACETSYRTRVHGPYRAVSALYVEPE